MPLIEAEETDYGLRVVARYTHRNARANQMLIPKIIMLKSSPAKGDQGFSDRAAWRVPLDDDSHLSFGVDLRHLTGDAAKRYRDAQAQERAQMKKLKLEPVDEVARQILAGRRSLEDEDILARPDLVNIQDCVAQMGQPKIAEGPYELLGRSDRGVILWRNMGARAQCARRWPATEALAGAQRTDDANRRDAELTTARATPREGAMPNDADQFRVRAL